MEHRQFQLCLRSRAKWLRSKAYSIVITSEITDVQTFFNQKKSACSSGESFPSPRVCASILLSGPADPNAPVVFLLPDGFGSASSYIGLPSLSSYIRLIGFDSPYLSSHQSSVVIEDIASIYVSSIIELQPHGPYILGGWSIGGVYAFEIATQLAALGELLQGLVLIDSPCPIVTPPVPVEAIEILDRKGLFMDYNKKRERLPANDTEHFHRGTEALKAYKPSTWSADARPPRCTAIWARLAVGEALTERDRKALTVEMERNGKIECEWLQEKGEEFGAGGWETLLPEVESHFVEADHFSIVKRPQVWFHGGRSEVVCSLTPV